MLWIVFISLLCFGLVPCVKTFEFCSNNSVIDETYFSCSYQLWPNNIIDDDCQVKRYELDDECQVVLPEPPTRRTPQRGIIKIEPYKNFTERRTLFNLTAHNIEWNNFKIRFRQQNVNRCMRKEFFVKKPVPKGNYLYFNCPWQTADYEDKIIDFEYAYGVNNIYDGKRTFVIHVPRYETLDNYKTTFLQNLTIFSYVETTDLFQLIYKIHTAPAHLNVTFYEIIVNITKNNVIRTDGPHIRDAAKAVLNVIDFEYDTFGIPGEYVFKVRPWNCPECFYSMSAVITIPETSTILTIGIVGVSCLIPIFLITLYIYFKVDSGSIPRVLLITTPANNAHKIIGISLANLLTQKYNIPTMIDIIDNPIAKIIPAEWLRNSFNRATHVVILISDRKPVTCIYRNIDNVLLSLIQTNPNKICCSIKFPFSQETNLNFNVHRNFQLMEDYKAFINFIHNRGFLHRLMYKVRRNDLYYDLIKQINSYTNNTVVIAQSPIKCDNEYNDQNKKNNSMEHPLKVELPPDKIELVNVCLQNKYKSSMENDKFCTDEDQSDTQSIDSTLQYLLEEVFSNQTDN